MTPAILVNRVFHVHGIAVSVKIPVEMVFAVVPKIAKSVKMIAVYVLMSVGMVYVDTLKHVQVAKMIVENVQIIAETSDVGQQRIVNDALKIVGHAPPLAGMVSVPGRKHAFPVLEIAEHALHVVTDFANLRKIAFFAPMIVVFALMFAGMGTVV